MIVVHAHGTFDGLHAGHVAYLKAARLQGDCLIVTLTAGRWVNKGPGRPIFSDEERLAMVRELRCVSLALLADEVGPETMIRMIRPNVYCKGREYEGRLPEQALVESLGGRVAFIDAQPVYSSTRLLTGAEYRARLGAIGTGAR